MFIGKKLNGRILKWSELVFLMVKLLRFANCFIVIEYLRNQRYSITIKQLAKRNNLTIYHTFSALPSSTHLLHRLL